MRPFYAHLVDMGELVNRKLTFAIIAALGSKTKAAQTTFFAAQTSVFYAQVAYSALPQHILITLFMSTNLQGTKRTQRLSVQKNALESLMYIYTCQRMPRTFKKGAS